MSDHDASPNRFLAFWTSLPGLITAVATLVTAVGGLLVYVNATHEVAPPERVVSISEDAGPPPTDGSGETADDITGPAAQDIAEAGMDAGASSNLVEDCAGGDPYACATVLETLALACFDGDPASCDLIYWVSPIGSAYEWYGGTCGARLPELASNGCTETYQ
jgi:hypothetical protein